MYPGEQLVLRPRFPLGRLPQGLDLVRGPYPLESLGFDLALSIRPSIRKRADLAGFPRPRLLEPHLQYPCSQRSSPECLVSQNSQLRHPAV
jgi:hypothetical protein